MENPTQFDLNEAIRRWRNDLQHSPAFRGEDLEELETHLRDAVQHFETKGLTAEESFWIARKRLGGDQALACEFSKLNQSQIWLERAVWIVVGSMAIEMATILAGSLTNCLLLLAYHWSLHSLTIGILSPFLYAGTWVGGILWLWKLTTQPGSRLQQRWPWMRRHPWASGMLLIGLLLITHCGATLASMLSAQTISVSKYPVIFFQWAAIWKMLLRILLIPALLACLLHRLRRREKNHDVVAS